MQALSEDFHRDPAATATGCFVDDDGQTWYRIDGVDQMPPFFVALAGDSDLWAFVSTAGSLACGRRDQEGSFLPYETVDKVHRRWEHTGPRSWILIDAEASTGVEGIESPAGASALWQPFALDCAVGARARSVWKNLSSTRLRFREEDPSGRVALQVEWSSAASLGWVRSARLQALDASRSPVSVRVLDGIQNLVPPGVSFEHASTMSSLSDAYKWNESVAGGRLGLFTLYAQIWDRAEPKESFLALTGWHAGLPASARSLLSSHQVTAFCRTGRVQPEPLTRGRKGAWLVHFEVELSAGGPPIEWHLVLDGPRSQVQVHELAQRLLQGGGTPAEIRDALARNTSGVDELLTRADGMQSSGDPMAAAHHRANVLFNIMRGGVFVDGTRLDRDDLLDFIRQRLHAVGEELAPAAHDWPAKLERAEALAAARTLGPQIERLVLEYLPLTFSRRHGDPSRPWNRFSIRVRDAAGRRVVNYQGNWRDIFQNWEALATSEPAYLGSMITTFLGAMTPDGYNPYRISRDGIDWEVPVADDPWAHIGYWGDHQIVYLLRLLEAQQACDPSFLAAHWDRALFSFADVPYRLKPYRQMADHPRDTIDFDEAAHHAALARAVQRGSDGLRVCGPDGLPILATIGEKLAVILLAKAGSLVPGGGLWLHTQRPEWNDANNALAGTGLSVVTLAYLRRMLSFILGLPAASESFALPAATLQALLGFAQLLRDTPSTAVHDAAARRAFMDGVGALLDPWRAAAYQGAATRDMVQAPAGLLTDLARLLLPLVDATLDANRRADGLFQSYNLIDLRDGRAEVGFLYPMLEGQVALLSCGYLSMAEAVALMDALYASDLYTAGRASFLLYPDRQLPGFLERNRLDAQALALPIVQALLEAGRTDLLHRQSDGIVRFAPELGNRADLERVGADLGAGLQSLADAYERVLHHHAFTGRSGTMFGYEGLGCIYWHMVAKLLLAVQENVFHAADRGAPELPALQRHYRRVRDGLGYRKRAADYGAFPADPYSHTPAEGGAQQPGMTGQVKEEILARWGELGLRVQQGRVRFDPVLLDALEVPEQGALRFTYAQRPCTWRRGPVTRLKVRTQAGWIDCPDRSFDPASVLELDAEIRFEAP
jgi:hypothetical protein